MSVSSKHRHWSHSNGRRIGTVVINPKLTEHVCSAIIWFRSKYRQSNTIIDVKGSVKILFGSASKATVFSRTSLFPPKKTLQYIAWTRRHSVCLLLFVSHLTTAELTEDMLSSLETFFGNSVEDMLPVGPRACRCPVGHYEGKAAVPSRPFTKLTGLMTCRRRYRQLYVFTAFVVFYGCSLRILLSWKIRLVDFCTEGPSSQKLELEETCLLKTKLFKEWPFRNSDFSW